MYVVCLEGWVVGNGFLFVFKPATDWPVCCMFNFYANAFLTYVSFTLSLYASVLYVKHVEFPCY